MTTRKTYTIMKEVILLQKGAKKLAELTQTLSDLDGLNVTMLAEADRLAKSLENIDARILLAVQPDGKNLPPDESKRLERLNALKDKIGLLPGAKANVKRKLEALESELEEGYREAFWKCRSLAVDRLSIELGEEAERNLLRCGRDGGRAMKAAKAAAEHGELQLWVNWFGSHTTIGDLFGRIERLAAGVARFEAGQPVRPLPDTPAVGSGAAGAGE